MGSPIAVALARYDAACRALAEARSVDEVKDIRDQAVAMACYARKANNRDLEADAVAIRLDATRKLGALIRAQREPVGLNTDTRGQLTGGLAILVFWLGAQVFIGPCAMCRRLSSGGVG